MAKKLPLTPKLQELLRASSEGSLDPNSVSCFETISINTLPVSKNGLFSKAQHSVVTLQQMAAQANDPKNHVPLHLSHDQPYGELPVGKTIYAEVLNDNGVDELRSIFYLPNSEAELIAKVDTGVISEVSIGARYKNLNCSLCGFDFMGADATMDNIYDATCASDHVMGEDGAHLILNGSDRWLEQSLVSLGAAKGAKIQAHTKLLLGEDVYTRLAATGKDPARTTLFASATPIPKDEQMDAAQLVAQITAQAVTNATALAAKDTEIAALKASLATAQADAAKLADAVKELDTAKVELSALKGTDTAKVVAERDLALSFVRTEANRIAIGAGLTPVAADADIAALTATITTGRAKMQDIFPVGGRTIPQGGDGTAPKSSPSAFKTR